MATTASVSPSSVALPARLSWRRLLLIVLGAASTVIVVGGVRAVAELLNPLLMAGFLALLLQPLLNRLRPMGGWAVAVAVLILVLVGLALVGFVGISLRQLALEVPHYQDELRGLLTSISQQLAARGINSAAYIESALSGPAVGRTVFRVVSALAGEFGNAALTVFLFAFLIGGMWELERRAKREALDHSPAAERFMDFATTIRGYMGVRALLGLAAAVLNYALLLLVGVDHALLWGLLSFLLSFVPNIGFLLSVVPPMLLALLSKGWVSAAIVLIGYVVINSALDNVIGPRIVARQVNISPLLSFLSVLFWAWVLGPIGAVLAVPLTVLIQRLAWGPDPAALVPARPVTPSTVPTP